MAFAKIDMMKYLLLLNTLLLSVSQAREIVGKKLTDCLVNKPYIENTKGLKEYVILLGPTSYELEKSHFLERSSNVKKYLRYYKKAMIDKEDAYTKIETGYLNELKKQWTALKQLKNVSFAGIDLYVYRDQDAAAGYALVKGGVIIKYFSYSEE